MHNKSSQLISHFIRIAIILIVVLFNLTSCFLPFEKYTVIEPQKSRIILLTDILNEADDSQTLAHLLVYANKLDIEGLIAATSCHQYLGKNDTNPVRNGTHPEEIVKFIKAYGDVRNNLLKHENGWPTAEYLLSIVGAGPQGFGTRDIGIGRSTSGSRIIANSIEKKDSRPLYIVVNTGSNCLAQALIDLQEKMPREKLEKLLENVRVCDNAGQDNAGAWIAHNFPKLHYKRSSNQVYNFMNDQGPVTWDSAMYPGQGQHNWARQHIQTNHGALGAIYPTRMKWKDPNTFSTLEGGGSGNFIGFVNHGLYNPEHINWGGWGGRFDTVLAENIYANQLKWAEPDLFDSENEFKPYFMFPQASDKWVDPETGIKYEGIGVPIYRWRRAYQNDFEARMDWCIQAFDKANHNPIAAFNGDKSDGIVFFDAKPGDAVTFDGSASTDPDKDSLLYRWYIYPEAGNYTGEVNVSNSNSSKANIQIPSMATGKQIHLILEVRDNGVPQLYDYRRIVMNIK